VRPLLVITSHTARSSARTGIQALVRGLLYGLSENGADFQAVRWSNWRQSVVPLSRSDQQHLCLTLPGPRNRAAARNVAGSWLLLPEVIYEMNPTRLIRYARKRRMRAVAIFHDAIPITDPHFVRPQAARLHPRYMTALADVDLLIAVSNSAAEQFRLFVQKHRLRLPPICVCRSPGELPGIKRPSFKQVSSDAVNILCVSTLEPRKNHKVLLKAFELAALNRPRLSLYLVGDRYKHANSIADLVIAATSRNPNIAWSEHVTDDELANFYRECDFTVYPSVLEGFGLPIVQSLWNRRPCICANFGAMEETAFGGGCVTVDVREPAKLSEAMVAVASDSNLQQRLHDEIEKRHHKTWAEYASEIQEALARVGGS
jgi:glycosyltransferase involved in cell wall biosynthesis